MWRKTGVFGRPFNHLLYSSLSQHLATRQPTPELPAESQGQVCIVYTVYIVTLCVLDLIERWKSRPQPNKRRRTRKRRVGGMCWRRGPSLPFYCWFWPTRWRTACNNNNNYNVVLPCLKQFDVVFTFLLVLFHSFFILLHSIYSHSRQFYLIKRRRRRKIGDSFFYFFDLRTEITPAAGVYSLFLLLYVTLLQKYTQFRFQSTVRPATSNNKRMKLTGDWPTIHDWMTEQKNSAANFGMQLAKFWMNGLHSQNQQQRQTLNIYVCTYTL